nr:glycogen debranching N-terminal domain-containing protein [Arthrobacter sp. Br18]
MSSGAWADDHGQIRGVGAQGIHCGDDRVVSHAVLMVDGKEPEWVSTQVHGAHSVDYVHFVRVQSSAADPLVHLIRKRTADAAGISESIHIESAQDFLVHLEVECSITVDNTPMEKVKSGNAAASELTVDGLEWNWCTAETRARLDAGSAATHFAGDTIRLTWSVELGPGDGGASLALEPLRCRRAHGGTQHLPSRSSTPRGPQTRSTDEPLCL